MLWLYEASWLCVVHTTKKPLNTYSRERFIREALSYVVPLLFQIQTPKKLVNKKMLKRP